MRIAMSGASGLIGSALCESLAAGGHDVLRLTRRAPIEVGQVGWDPADGRLDAQSLAGVDAIVHLAGENIADARWTGEKKRRILASRVDGARLLAETAAAFDPRPAAFVCASAVGFYGDRGDQWCDEQTPSGAGFLPEVCRQWEAACEPAREAGVRVVNLRLGPVLSPAGGALAKMLTPFRVGLGGRIGSGRQYFSWIAIDDAVGAFEHALHTPSLEGPANAVAPNPVTNRELTRTLGGVLRRPTFMPTSAFALRLAFGRMADEMLLASTRVRPTRLLASGYEFRHPTLQGALRHVLGLAPAGA